jgi:leucine dehydrogenase
MEIFDQMAVHDHEQVIAFQNNATGLRGFLAIHDTTLGPALGGVRIRRFADDAEALADALRLSRAMTYKASLAELPCGGGKTVIPLHDGLKRAEAFQAFGTLVENLRGRYFCARDVGITDDDLGNIAHTTSYVAREPSPELGDISEHTAIGVWHGMRACLDFAGIKKKPRVGIQGVGSVGLWLARLLMKEGIELVLADLDAGRAQQAGRELGAQVVAPEEILAASCDVLAPCALGGVVTTESAARIQAPIVCGSANNILATPEAGDALAHRGILYAPDYLVNAGGLIRGAEFYLLRRADSRASLARIYDRMRRVLELARARKISTARVADELAETRLKRPKSFRDLTWAQRVAAPS